MRKRFIFNSLIMFFIFSIVSICEVRAEKKYPFPDGEVTVSNNKIFINGKLFAEIRFLSGLSEMNEGYCDGIAIFYHTFKKEVWIHPKKGWSVFVVEDEKYYNTVPDIMRQLALNHYDIEKGISNSNKILPYREGKIDWFIHYADSPVSTVTISKNGKYVKFKTYFYRIFGLEFKSSHEYLVEYGVAK